jgi:hypothetical protein
LRTVERNYEMNIFRVAGWFWAGLLCILLGCGCEFTGQGFLLLGHWLMELADRLIIFAVASGERWSE